MVEETCSPHGHEEAKKTRMGPNDSTSFHYTLPPKGFAPHVTLQASDQAFSAWPSAILKN
jgi:hypothetical protein